MLKKLIDLTDAELRTVFGTGLLDARIFSEAERTSDANLASDIKGLPCIYDGGTPAEYMTLKDVDAWEFVEWAENINAELARACRLWAENDSDNFLKEKAHNAILLHVQELCDARYNSAFQLEVFEFAVSEGDFDDYAWDGEKLWQLRLITDANKERR